MTKLRNIIVRNALKFSPGFITRKLSKKMISIVVVYVIKHVVIKKMINLYLRRGKLFNITFIAKSL